MLEPNLIYTIIRTFPESIVVILSGMMLLGIKIEIKDLLKKGLLLGAIIGFIRLLLPISFGVHTVLSMIALEIIFFKISNNDIVKSTITTCCIWIALALSEGIYVVLTTTFIGLSIDLLMDKTALGAIVTLPSLLITLGIVIILKNTKSKLRKFNIGN